jgi:1-acyl-sn-glycerol-3-phosphate acyltransferase
MTMTAAHPTKVHTAPEHVRLPRRSDLLYRWFRWWVRGYLRKHFHAVRLARGTRPDVPSDLPLIVVLNHPSWWDPLIGVVLAGLFPEHVHYAPMEANALGRYSLFRRLGFYGIDRGTPRGAVAFLRTTTAILSQPRSAVWITAQGRFTDPRVRPTLLRPGVGHIARRLDGSLILTLALEYVFWEERLPEALCRFGEPIWIEGDQGLRVSEWVERIQVSLTSAQDALRDAALSRDPTGFETLLMGKVAIGGIYDLGRRLRAWLRGERFRPEHGSEGERP